LTLYHDNVRALVDRILQQVGTDIVLGLPLGLGKANHVANELYARAAADPGIRLRIFTGLTLEPKRWKTDLERRLLEPLNARLYSGYPRLSYADAVRENALPPNIEVNEFFLQAGNWLDAPLAQQNYVSVNYTQAADHLLDCGLNVIAQLVAKRGAGADAVLSLSCNPDVTLDVLSKMQQKRRRGQRAVIVGQVNSELPFMGGEAALPAAAFDHLLDAEAYDFPLFDAPRLPVSDAEYAIGLRCAALIPDAGTLQIGIGSIGDAVAYSLCLRHQHNAVFRAALDRLDAGTAGAGERLAPRIRPALGPFSEGLYAASEMFVEGFLDLYRAGVLARPVEDGALLHSAFFLGSTPFYRALREMPDAERGRFRMAAVSFVNQAQGDGERKRRDRVHARFINTAMMATALGAVVSDTLDDGRVVSGVGGQYDFVAQAFALDGARSLIALPATRHIGGRLVSSIVWRYGQTTIPRQLRDIVVTEYGVADLRGRTDRDCIAAMSALSDSRFQDGVVREAKAARKIERRFEVPAPFRRNLPERIEEALKPARDQGFFPAFPFGSDLTAEEQRLLPAFKWIESVSNSKWKLARAALAGLLDHEPTEGARRALARLSLDYPRGLRERFLRALVKHALSTPSGRF
jgi:hypothetical protein